jgi:predicted alpha/beta hydrolase family esterase
MQRVKQVLFIQGGGEDGYEADRSLVKSLQQALGEYFIISYPPMPDDNDQPDFGWPGKIGEEINKFPNELIIVAHSLGASLLLKYLSENKYPKTVSGIFLLATPFWQGKEQWKQELMLREDFAEKLPKDMIIYLYHCRDDEEVPFDHLALYRAKLPSAKICELQTGGHQFENNLNQVASDIKNWAK